VAQVGHDEAEVRGDEDEIEDDLPPVSSGSPVGSGNEVSA
jgi:hypothetical protein